MKSGRYLGTFNGNVVSSLEIYHFSLPPPPISLLFPILSLPLYVATPAWNEDCLLSLQTRTHFQRAGTVRITLLGHSHWVITELETEDSCPGESQQQIITLFFIYEREGKERTEKKYENFKRGMNIERKNWISCSQPIAPHDISQREIQLWRYMPHLHSEYFFSS